MKKLPLILSIVSLIGVIAVLILTLAIKNCSKETTIPAPKIYNGDLKVAYLNTDSVLLNYQLAIDLNNDFIEKQKQYTTEFGKRKENFQKEAVAFQDKVQRGGFLTEARAIKERDRILGEEQEIKKMDYELSNKLAQMEQQVNKQLVDSIVNYVEEYNKTHNYTYILSNTGQIIIGEQTLNISKDILDGLNARYKKGKE